ncbi:MAG: hypothetical protein V3R87_10830 [Dehalococcoidia bacterium]
MKATELCPIMSDMTFMLTPASSIMLAKVCRKSWNLVCGRPASLTILAKPWVSELASIGLPS